MDVCPDGTFGINCQEKCVCENGAKCSSTNGACICTNGWKGKLCNTRACPEDLWGPKCQHPCQCNKENSEMYVKVTNLIVHKNKYILDVTRGRASANVRLAGIHKIVLDLVQYLPLVKDVMAYVNV